MAIQPEVAVPVGLELVQVFQSQQVLITQLLWVVVVLVALRLQTERQQME